MKNIFTLLGILAAIILFGGYLHRAGIRVTQQGADAAPATTTTEQDQFFATEDSPVRGEVEMFDPDRHYRNTPEGFDRVGRSAAAAERSAKPAVSETDVQRWIRRQGPVAIMEAVRQGVPAGISLAVSVQALQQGKIDLRSDFNQAVVTPLAAYKESGERAYFKYSANSESWLAGLAKASNYDTRELDAILRRYDLAAYDAEVYLALQNERRNDQSSPAARRTYAASVAKPSERETAGSSRSEDEVADEKLRANMAYSMNRLVDKQLEEKGKDMTFTTRTEPAAEVKTQARRLAESIAVGKSKSFNNPTEFHNVLREVLALEAGYDSWADYRAADASGAKRAFIQRSDLMANGGKMVITRRR